MRVLGVLAGGDMPENLLIKWAKSADILIAADYGAKILIEHGFEPTIVGDMDSLPESSMRGQLDIRHDSDQSTTDCDKLLAYALSQELNSISLIGIEGDLLDHVLAALYSASRSPMGVRLALRRGLGWLLRPGVHATVTTQPGRRVSLLPITRASGVDIQGVQWPLADDVLEPHGKVSISNVANSDTVSVSIREGSAMLFVEFPEAEMPRWD